MNFIYLLFIIIHKRFWNRKKINSIVIYYNIETILQRKPDKKILKRYRLENIRDTICFLILRLMYVNIYIYIFMHAAQFFEKIKE